MNADAKFHFVFRQRKRGFARSGNGAGGKGDADGEAVVIDAFAEGDQFVQTCALLGGGTQQFFHDHGVGDAASACGIKAVLDRHIIIGKHKADINAEIVQQFGGGFKIKHVAGVVIDDEQYTATAICRLRARQHLIRGGRSENFAGHGTIKHAFADKAAVHGFMTAAAAGNQRHFIGHRRISAGEEVRLKMELDFRMRGNKAAQLFEQDAINLINQFFHDNSLHQNTIENSGDDGARDRACHWHPAISPVG